MPKNTAQRGVIVPKIAPISGRYYGHRNFYGGTPTTAAVGANTLYAQLFAVPVAMTADRIAINVTGAGAAATGVRLGVYSALANGQPDALLVDSGALLVDTTGTKTATISQVFVPGVQYWLALVSDGTPTFAATVVVGGPLGSTDPSTASSTVTCVRAFTYAALPAAWGTPTSYGGTVPHICVRAV